MPAKAPYANTQELKRTINDPIFAEAAEGYFAEPVPSLAYWVGKSVEGSTFRAYRMALTYKPSSIYRTWALESLSRNGELSEILDSDNRDFAAFHRTAITSLERFWCDIDGSKLSYGQSRKLVDLLFKHLPICSQFDPNVREWMLESAHVPLDKYTLHYISVIANQFRRGLIPEIPSMGDVTEDNYASIQNVIRTSCAPLPALYFDVLAWNNDHPEIIENQLVERHDNRGVQRTAERAQQGLLTK